MASPIKTGFLQRYSRKFMQEGWKSIWCVLYGDSTFAWYKQQSDRTPKGQVNLKNIANFFAVGAYATRIPNAPRVSDQQAALLLALPDRPSRDAFVEFFMANSQQELNEWMEKIVTTLPQQGPPGGAPPQGPPTSSSAPYPQQGGYPAAPPPGGIGFAGMPQPGGPPPGYPGPGGYPPAGAPPGGYPPPSGYPPQGGYPQQAGYPQSYPQQQGYPQQGYPAGAYAAGAAGAAYGAQQPAHEIVYVNGKPKKKKKKILGVNQNTAAGVVGGAAAGYMLGKMTGGFGGWGHGFGGGWGSWSSLSSFGSFGSCGSFGSFD